MWMSIHHAMVELKHKQTLRSCIFLRGFALHYESSSQPWEAWSFLICWLCCMQYCVALLCKCLKGSWFVLNFLLWVNITQFAWFLNSVSSSKPRIGCYPYLFPWIALELRRFNVVSSLHLSQGWQKGLVASWCSSLKLVKVPSRLQTSYLQVKSLPCTHSFH